MASACTWYETSRNYVVVELHCCQNCSRWMTGFHGQKYCVQCGRNYLLIKQDPIDLEIAEMVKEQENLLRRKYMRLALSNEDNSGNRGNVGYHESSNQGLS